MASERKLSIAEQAAKLGLQFIDLQFADIAGTLKSVTVPVHRFASIEVRPQWFDGSSIEGFARVSENDMYLRPDPDSFAAVPWDVPGERTGRVICEVFSPQGEPFAGDPRSVLRRAVGHAAELGVAYQASPEVEFFLVRPHPEGMPPTPHDAAGYFDVSSDLGQKIRKHMVLMLEAMGPRVEASHHELGKGQHEIDISALPDLAAADAIITLKWIAKVAAQQQGLEASFMPKPIYGMAGSGMHVHQSLVRIDGGDNLFSDASDQYGLSQIGRHFIAGQLAHARGMSAVLAPLVNSYKRLLTGFEAPGFITWARTNHSSLIRVPETRPEDAGAARAELRLPDPSCNPYLALAVMLRAGLDGIERELPLPEAVEEQIFAVGPAAYIKHRLPNVPPDLNEALNELEQDDVVCDALGSYMLERFVEGKRIEWEEYRSQVTPWELQRYLTHY